MIVHSRRAMRLGLTIHAASFVVGMIVVTVTNFLVGPPYWVHWVFLGWGIGLISHWLSVTFCKPAEPKAT